MSSYNQYSQTWATSHQPATNETPTAPHPPTTQQHGAFPPHQQPRSADTVNPAIHGQIHPPQFSPTSTHPKSSHPHPTGNATSHDHIRTHQPSVLSPTHPRPTDPTHPGLQQQSEHPQWVLPVDGRSGPSGGQFPPSSVQPPIYSNNIAQSGRHPTNSSSPPEASPKKCRIPDCTYNAYYDFSEQEQTEYCGHGHELQAVSTGLVASCVMCKGRPRRTGERVCGRICRDRERQTPRVQGSYYGVSVSRARP